MNKRREPGALQPDEKTVVRRHGVNPSRAHADREREGEPGAQTPSGGRPVTDTHGSDAGDSRSSRGATPLSDSIHPSSTAVVASEAVASDEATRARGFSAVIGVAALLVCSVIPLLGGDPMAKKLCIAALVYMVAVSVWVWRVTGLTSRYPRRVNRIYGWSLATGVIFLEYYLGFFSPAVVVVTLGVYFFAQSTDRAYSIIIPVYAIVTYAVPAALTAFGIIEDRGLFSAEHADLSARVFAVAAIGVVFGLTLRMSHIARASMLRAIKTSNEALLLAQKDEALLAEARHQLDHALRIAVGRPGRYTGQMAGAYRLGLIIGVGAMGEVYAAEHPESGERVAVKLLQADAAVDGTLFERFRRESEICLELCHPNLVQVFDVGRLDDGSPYMTMERLEGEDLGARLRKREQLEPSEVVDLARDVAAGLQYAHDQGVIHRDLKPHNLFQAVDDQGHSRWKILDFGISKLRNSSNTLTREGIVGTPGYMSPEQAKGLVVDHRSDLFAMAAVVYRALTGRPAFPGPNTPQIMFDVVYRNPDRPSHAVAGLANDLELVLAIGLAKEADRRFQSAQQFAEALKAASRQELEPELRGRARKLLKRFPWNKVAVKR